MLADKLFSRLMFRLLLPCNMMCLRKKHKQPAILLLRKLSMEYRLPIHREVLTVRAGLIGLNCFAEEVFHCLPANNYCFATGAVWVRAMQNLLFPMLMPMLRFGI